MDSPALEFHSEALSEPDQGGPSRTWKLWHIPSCNPIVQHSKRWHVRMMTLLREGALPGNLSSTIHPVRVWEGSSRSHGLAQQHQPGCTLLLLTSPAWVKHQVDLYNKARAAHWRSARPGSCWGILWDFRGNGWYFSRNRTPVRLDWSLALGRALLIFNNV